MPVMREDGEVWQAENARSSEYARQGIAHMVMTRQVRDNDMIMSTDVRYESSTSKVLVARKILI